MRNASQTRRGSVVADTVLILANSYKHQNWCVAGKLTTTKQWVRLVGDRSGAALTTAQTSYTNTFGTYRLRPLKKIVMDIGDPVPLINQPENFLALPGWSQAHAKAFTPDQLHHYEDAPADLWGNGDSVSDRDIRSRAIVIRQSLYLIEVGDLRLYKTPYDKRRVSFDYNSQHYDLASTCPSYDKYHDGTMVPNGFICVSLGEDYQGDHYKIVATIFGA